MDWSSPLIFNALNHEARAKIVLVYRLREWPWNSQWLWWPLVAIWEGGGGGWQQVTHQLRQPGTWESHLFFIFSGLIVHHLTIERHLHNLYEPPPPPFNLCRGGGGGLEDRSSLGQWRVASCLHELGIYCTSWMPTIGLTPVNISSYRNTC